MPLTSSDFEKLGLFYLGRPVDPATGGDCAGAAALRLARPRDPRGDRGHDRERQDRARHRAARRGGDRRRAGAGDRSEGRPGESPARPFRSSAPATSGPGCATRTPTARASRSGRWRRRRRSGGARGWRLGTGRRAHPTPARRRRGRALHAGQRRWAGRSRSSPRSPLRPRRCARTPTCSATASRPPRPACWALVGVEADPLRSREHILLATCSPRPGAPAAATTCRRSSPRSRSRRSPRSASWTSRPSIPPRTASRSRCGSTTCSPLPASTSGCAGEPLDVDALLYTPAGKPRLAIVSIAHLSDAERMFFVSLLLNETIAWMRSQIGHRRACAPSSTWTRSSATCRRWRTRRRRSRCSTLLKQARAFGLGVVARDPEPGRPRLQGARRTSAPGSSAGCRPSATRRGCSTASRAPRRGGRRLRPRGDRQAPLRPALAPVPAAQRPRRRAGRLREPLGDVLPRRPARPRAAPRAGQGHAVRGRDSVSLSGRKTKGFQ